MPLAANSEILRSRYAALGGPVNVLVKAGRGHDMWSGWFRSRELTDFVIERALRPRAPEKLRRKKLQVFLLLLIVVALGAGGVFLVQWDIPPPDGQVVTVIPDERFPK